VWHLFGFWCGTRALGRLVWSHCGLVCMCGTSAVGKQYGAVVTLDVMNWLPCAGTVGVVEFLPSLFVVMGGCLRESNEEAHMQVGHRDSTCRPMVWRSLHSVVTCRHCCNLYACM
jgi:hypothetical protein